MDWAGILARLRARPGAWSLELPDTPAATLNSVTDRRHPALRAATDGRLHGDLRNAAPDPKTGQIRGDLYLMWVPAGTVVHPVPHHQEE